mgnify:FL=1
MSRRHGTGYVYLISDPMVGLHKVGATVQLDTRMRLIANGTLNDLVAVWYIRTNDCVRLEEAWLKHWADLRVKGEWFRLDACHVAEFKSIDSVRYSHWLDVPLPTEDPFLLPSMMPGCKKKNGKIARPIRLGEVIPQVRHRA